MRKYASEHAEKLLKNLAAEARKTANGAEKDAIHDLRVAIRRLRACLRLFAQFYPGHARKQLDREVKGLMHAAGDVRDRDIALDLLSDAGAPAASPAVQRLQRQRQKAAAALREALAEWAGRGIAGKWGERLEL